MNDLKLFRINEKYAKYVYTKNNRIIQAFNEKKVRPLEKIYQEFESVK